MSYGSYPAFRFGAITPSDTEKLSYNDEAVRTRGVYVGSAGNVAAADESGTSVIFYSVQAGTLLPISTEQILSTGTTASNLTALY